MTAAMNTDRMFDDTETLDPEAREIPLRLTREELLASADVGWRRDGWRFDDMEDDR